MLDFETLGTKADTVVLSLGAVIFNRDQILKKQLWHFSIEEQFKVKRSVTGDTICWWLKQGDEAKSVFERANKEGIPAKDFADQFNSFLKEVILGNEPNVIMDEHIRFKVWSNGASFDVPILEHFLNQCGRKIHWNFWDVRCYRTMKAMFGIEKGREREGTKHDALDDAIFQARCVMNYLQDNPERDK